MLEVYKHILPIIAFIPIGFLLQKWFTIPKDYISNILIYILLPVVVIANILEADVNKLFIIASISFLIALAMTLPAWLFKKYIDPDANIHYLKSTFTFFNVVFFGSPLITAIFGKEVLSSLFCVYLGTALYGNIIAFFNVSRTKLSVKEALIEVFKSPYIYTFIVAFGLLAFSVEVPEVMVKPLDVAGWIVSAGGMLIVGLSLKTIKIPKPSLIAISKLLGARTIAAALITALFVLIEYFTLDQLETKERALLALLPLLPVSSNLSIFASFLKTEEEKFSMTVVLSILLSLVIAPLSALFIS